MTHSPHPDRVAGGIVTPRPPGRAAGAGVTGRRGRFLPPRHPPRARNKRAAPAGLVPPAPGRLHLEARANHGMLKTITFGVATAVSISVPPSRTPNTDGSVVTIFSVSLSAPASPRTRPFITPVEPVLAVICWRLVSLWVPPRERMDTRPSWSPW